MGAQPLRAEHVRPLVHAANKRRHGRLRVESVQCSLGEVLDIAPMGLRVRCRGRSFISVGQGVSMTLATPMGLLAVEGVIVWVQKSSFWHSEVGVALVNMNDAVRRGMAAVAAACADGMRDADR